MRKLIKCDDFSSIGAGKTATVSLPVTGTYFGLSLFIAGTDNSGTYNQATMESTIESIVLKLNGYEQRRFSARQLFDINAFHGQSVQNGLMEIHFAEPWRPSTAGEDVFAWGMGGITSFTMEVKLATGTNVSSLDLRRSWSPITTANGTIKRWVLDNAQAGGAGHLQVRPVRDNAYASIHFDMASVTINNAAVKIDEEADFDEMTKTQLDSFYKQHGYNPQSDWFHLSPDAITGRYLDLWNMVRADKVTPVQSFRINLDAAGAGSIPYLQEIVGLRAG